MVEPYENIRAESELSCSLVARLRLFIINKPRLSGVILIISEQILRFREY